VHHDQSQKTGGSSNNIGPTSKFEGCNQEVSLSVAQPIKETPDKYSKVYIRQKHYLHKARPLHIEGNHPQLQQGDDASAIQTANQDKANN